jgi:hypothetical protein
MRYSFATLWASSILSHTVWAADIQKGAMQVKADSIWFQDISPFFHGQKLKNGVKIRVSVFRPAWRVPNSATGPDEPSTLYARGIMASRPITSNTRQSIKIAGANF